MNFAIKLPLTAHAGRRSVCMLLAFVTLMVSRADVGAAITPRSVQVEINARNELGYPVVIISGASLAPYSFDATIDVLVGGPRLKGDLYFGLIAHGTDEAFTWTRAGDDVVLTRGMVPMRTGIAMDVPDVIRTDDVLGKPATRIFSGTGKTGLYLMFVAIVLEGADPADPSKWLTMRLEPVVVQ